MTTVSFIRDAVPALPWQATETEPTDRFFKPKKKPISFASLAIPVVLVAAVSAALLAQLKIAPNPVSPNEFKSIHVAPVGRGAHLPPPHSGTSLAVSTRPDETESKITAGRQALTRIRENVDECHAQSASLNKSSTSRSRRLLSDHASKIWGNCFLASASVGLACLILTVVGLANWAATTNPTELQNYIADIFFKVLIMSLVLVGASTAGFVDARRQQKVPHGNWV
eukprot:GHVT01072907.1.p1 GENE.GHVT01072907.1~~GHVT01072907.1.p1  ORF type:complete len:226 (+),score=19.68 GHVT01072907.1:70-747(+)